jgi:hypothetical protein
MGGIEGHITKVASFVNEQIGRFAGSKSNLILSLPFDKRTKKSFITFTLVSRYKILILFQIPPFSSCRRMPVSRGFSFLLRPGATLVRLMESTFGDAGSTKPCCALRFANALYGSSLFRPMQLSHKDHLATDVHGLAQIKT